MCLTSSTRPALSGLCSLRPSDYAEHPAPEASTPTKAPDSDLLDPPRHNRVGFLEQMFLLMVRTAKNKLKGRSSLLVELIQSVAMGLIVGAVFFKLGHDQVSVQDRYGLFYIISTMYPFMVVLNTVAKRAACQCDC